MSSGPEPPCHCPSMRGGGIQHTTNCLWIAWKRGEYVEPKSVEKEPVSLPLERVLAPSGYRQTSALQINQLVVNIDAYGVQNPISVYEDCGYYIIIDGLHRVDACRRLGLRSIPGYINPKPQ